MNIFTKVLVICFLSIPSIFYSQHLDVQGKIKVAEMAQDTTADTLVVWLQDGTLGRRDASSLIEYQMLSISNDTVYLSNGGFVKITQAAGWTLEQDTTSTINNVGIGTKSPEAALDVMGNGFLPPRLSTTQRDQLTSVPLGLMIYNTTTNCNEIYRGAAWFNLCSGSYKTESVNILIGGSLGEGPKSIQQTSDGGFIMAGSTLSSESGDVSGTNNGGADYWIVKINASGSIEWDRIYGGDSSDIANSIQQTSDGGYVVAGYSYSSVSGDVSSTNNGFSDYWILKLSATGGIEWDTLIGGSGSDIPNEIQQTTDGGYIVAGYSFSSSSGDVTGENNGNIDCWIVKLNSTGGVQWDTLIGGDLRDFAESVQQTTDGGYIVGGYSNSSISGDVSSTLNGGFDYWIVKLNSAGGIQWDTLLGGSSDEGSYTIQQTPDGGYIVGGYSGSSISGDVSGINNGDYDYWIIKLNSGGGIEWDTLLGGSLYDEFTSLQQTSDGGYIAAGYSWSSTSGDVSGTNNGNADYWIIKLNSGGGKEWDALIGGSLIDIARSIKQTSDGGYIVAGSSNSSSSGDVSGTNKGINDIWIITLDKHGKIIK